MSFFKDMIRMSTADENDVSPAVGEEFELMVNNNINPMKVVTSAGIDKKGWNYLGPNLTGKVLYRVSFVRLGKVKNLAEAKGKADELGFRLLEGQARKPFEKKYPRLRGRERVIFGGSEWQSWQGGRNYNCVAALCRDNVNEWLPIFPWSEDPFDEYCYWAVVHKP